MSDSSSGGAIKFPKKLNQAFGKAFGDFDSAFRANQSAPMRITAAALFLAASAALLVMAFFEKERVRSVFFFPASADFAVSDTPPVPEIRYLDISAGGEPLSVYLSEYLLGSSEPGRASPFASRCTVARCFVRGNAAYIDLSPSDSGETVTDPAFAYRCRLLEKNICTNFENIDIIFLYFDGIEVYGGKH